MVKWVKQKCTNLYKMMKICIHFLVVLGYFDSARADFDRKLGTRFDRKL